MKLSSVEFNTLRLEYAWTHRCCNSNKSAVEFIIFEGDRYIPNISGIRSVIEKIIKICNREIEDIDAQIDMIIRYKVTPLLDIINANLRTAGDIEMYSLFCKFKLISSMNSAMFQRIARDFEDVYLTASVSARDVSLRSNPSRCKVTNI